MGRLTRRGLLWFAGCVACALALGPGCARAPAPDPLEPLRQRAAHVRGLEFREPVRLERVELAAVRGLLRREVEALYPEDELRAYEAAYRALGVLPPGVDLLQSLLELQAQELAGLYVARRKTMFVLREFSMGDVEGRLVILHELVHALQDQHHPEIFALLEGTRHDDDLATAIASVLEGDASLATLAGEGEADQRKVEVATRMRELMLKELRGPGVPEIPLLLRASLTFPYAHGTVLAAREFSAGGNAALDRTIEDPPLSSRDLVVGGRVPVEFAELPWDRIAADAEQRECEVGHHNVAGVLTLGVLFEAHGSALPPELLAEWRGDRFLHVRCPQAPELFWVIRWSRPAAAASFAERYRPIAPQVAAWAGHSAPASAVAQREDVVIATPELAPLAPSWLAHSSFRRHEHLADWLAQGCPGEPACPPALAPRASTLHQPGGS